MSVSTVPAAPRDLAWCRAAFRDLDAPVPGRATSLADRRPPRRDWATGPVGPGPDAHRLVPHPPTALLVGQVVADSGHAPRRVDRVGATLLAWDEITRVGTEHLRGDAAATRALAAVRARWDLDEPMLWHVFGHHGERGVSAQRAVVEELYERRGLRRTLARAIASGRLLRF